MLIAQFNLDPVELKEFRRVWSHMRPNSSHNALSCIRTMRQICCSLSLAASKEGSCAEEWKPSEKVKPGTKTDIDNLVALMGTLTVAKHDGKIHTGEDMNDYLQG